MNKTDIAKTRLYNQRLIGHQFKTVAEVVNAFGAIQAQDYDGGLWTIGMRVKDFTEKDVEKAIENKEIVRTWPMRGTLHFVPAEDAKWMVKHLTPRVLQKTASLYRKHDLNETVFKRSAEILSSVMYHGEQLTRAEVYAALIAKGVATKGMRGVLILGELAMEGILCFGTPRGKQQTFTLLDKWITNSKDLTKEEGLELLAKRFFTSHGPATVKDFAWWCGVTLEEANSAFESIKKDLIEETIEGKSYYMAVTKVVKDVESAHLLQGYDEYTIAYRDNAGTIIDTEHLNKFDEPGTFISMFIINGKISGTWKKTVKADKVVIHTRPFYKLSDSEKQLLVVAAENYGNFLDLPAVLIID